MKNMYFICIAFCLILGTSVRGQERPKVLLDKSFECDTTPYQLVFYDDFDGNQLDTNFWSTYLSWHGIWQEIDGKKVYGDHPFSCGARKNNNNAFYKDENVIVSDGTCKLLIKNEKHTLDCIIGPFETAADCKGNDIDCPGTNTRYYTTGGIFSKFRFANDPDGSPNLNHFSNGRFEARLRHPIFDGAWTCMWTWYGTRVNEIDITEAWGGKPRTFNNLLLYAGGKKSQQLRSNNITFHAWNYKDNPYGFPKTGEDTPKPQAFSGQSWTDLLAGKPVHRQEDWHTYACEWDTAVVRIYLDGKLEMEYWKYFKYQDFSAQNLWGTYKIRIPATCHADSGVYYLSEAFPYENNSMSQLRLSTSLTQDKIGLPVSNKTLGLMEIDYVKIWQRHPEQDGRTAIVDKKVGRIIEPEKQEATPIRIVTVRNRIADSMQQLLLTAVSEQQGAIYKWQVVYGSVAGHLDTFYSEGQTVATDFIVSQKDSFFLSWQLQILDRNNELQIYEGLKDWDQYNAPSLSINDSYIAADSTALYLQSKMNEKEWKQYENVVAQQVAQLYFAPTLASSEIVRSIHTMRMQLLLPFLYFDDLETLQILEEEKWAGNNNGKK